MDWNALSLSLQLAGWTMLVLLPLAVLLARWLAWSEARYKPLVEAIATLPLVLPPTVLGYYLLTAFGEAGSLGRIWNAVFGHALAFSFDGLVLASLLANIPFALQPLLRSFAAIGRDVREAAWCSGLSPWRTFWRIEMPLAWPGLAAASVMVFAHTLGEFGVLLMVGGAIDGRTKTISIAIYDRMQAFDDAGAAVMAVTLLFISFAAIAFTFLVGRRRNAP